MAVDDLILAVSIPIFFVLILLERQVDRRRPELKLYRFHDSVTDLSCGIGNVVTGVVWGGLLVVAYLHLEPYAFIQLDGWVEWVVALLAYDLAYYWWHRLSHRVNFLWAAHIVHHQSEDFNLAVALRQAWFTSWTGWPFYLPLALLGVSTEVYLATAALNTIGQFWFHTRAIDRMGFFEWFLNTPSHHRVHHGIDPEYIDKNYAGLFIVWDRLFGTFTEERQEPIYGTVEALQSWNPIWANFQYWGVIWRKMRQTPGWRKLWVPWAPPEWTHEGDLQIPVPSGEKWTTPVTRQHVRYVVAHFLPVSVIVMVLLTVPLDLEAQIALVGLTLFSTLTWGGLFESRWWGRPLERVRLVALVVTAAFLGPVWAALALAVAGVSWVKLPQPQASG